MSSSRHSIATALASELDRRRDTIQAFLHTTDRQWDALLKTLSAESEPAVRCDDEQVCAFGKCLTPGAECTDARECEKIRVVSIAHLLAEAIRRINNEESISTLFV